MQIEQGRQAVWQHAKEAGIADDIKLIASHFDIKDVCIIFGGKMTFIEDKPRKQIRIAVATRSDKKVADYIKETKAKK